LGRNVEIEIDHRVMNRLGVWFSAYVKSFEHNDNALRQHIILKKEHTKRVCREIKHLGKSLGLNRNNLLLAEIIALFHDIGRFEQIARYHTFVDRKSENHAELGIQILQQHRVLDRFEDSVKNLIFRAINYHNRAGLPSEEAATCLFYSKLLRDADKLDIWRVVTDYYHQHDSERNEAIELGLPDTAGFSCGVYRDLNDQKIVDIHHVKNLNDFKLLQIGWVYDVNFQPTFHAIRSRKYLQLIRDVLPEDKKIEDIFSKIYFYIDEILGEKT
jgi:putative nucleotidyltransferase with HDIG domain